MSKVIVKQWARVEPVAIPDEDAEGVLSQNVAERCYKPGTEHWAAQTPDGLWYVMQGAGTRWDQIRAFTTEQMKRYFRSLRGKDGKVITPLPWTVPGLLRELEAHQDALDF